MSVSTSNDMAPLLPTRELAVFIVFFGQLPPWLPLTLHSMAANRRVEIKIIPFDQQDIQAAQSQGM